MAQTNEKGSEFNSEEKGRYSEGNAYKRGESPSEVKDPANSRADRSSIAKSAASAYRKMSENDNSGAPGRG